MHVEPREDGWAVVREGNERATSVHETQAEAAEEGRELARSNETEFFLYAQDGRIREHHSYEEASARIYEAVHNEAVHNLRPTFATVNLALIPGTPPGVTAFSWEKP